MGPAEVDPVDSKKYAVQHISGERKPKNIGKSKIFPLLAPIGEVLQAS
jgi:hypothetical protein